jgi:hypothetical protein
MTVPFDPAETTTAVWIAASGVVIGSFGVVHSFVSSLLANRRSKEQIAVARMQLRASILSASRTAWINEFRTRLASSLSRLEHLGLYNMRVQKKLEEDGSLGPDDRDNERREMTNLLRDAEAEVLVVELMLSPDEEDHKELVQTLRRLEDSVQLSKIMHSQKELPDGCRKVVALG